MYPTSPQHPRGAVSVVVVLLCAILAAMVVLIVVLVTQGPAKPTETNADPPHSTTTAKYKADPTPSTEKDTPKTASKYKTMPVVADGQTVTREELPKPPEKPKPVGNPDRIKEVLQPGKVYRVVLKVGLDSKVVDRDWGIEAVVNVAYAAEMELNRTIESNDGGKIVELRKFEAARNAKLLSKVESLRVDLGLPGTLILGALSTWAPETLAVVSTVQPVAELILKAGFQQHLNDDNAKAFAYVDGLKGKSVRITYIDGIGVSEITPLGCTLTEDERDFIFTTAILSDCYLLPDVKIEPGKTWKVDGAQFAGMIDPSLHASPKGEITVEREGDVTENNKQYAKLRVKSGSLLLDTSDSSTRRMGTFLPKGTLRYSITDGFVTQADLTGEMSIERVSKDHILFETSFRSRPTLHVSYWCGILR